MTEERWTQLVRKLEDFAARKPRAYRVRVGLLAGAGYGYLLLLIALVLGLIAGITLLAISTALLILKFAWPLLILVGVMVRSLWFRIPPPEGLELKRADAPDLWALVDRIRKDLDGTKVHHILLDDELNAGVVQVPRFGMAGPQRNYLIVGLPLMQALSEAQFTAVLAHEFGHLSGNHSRFAGWIYRLRRTYAQMLESLEEHRSKGAWFVRRFFEWYSPYFSAYSFALARQDEYVADRAAAEVAGVDASAGALARIRLTARWLGGSYWPELHRRVEQEETAPRTAFTTLRERLPLRPTEDLEGELATALAEPTGLADTHPALKDRLAAMEVDPGRARDLAAEAPARSAAAVLLGEREAELVAHFDARYHEDVSPEWRRRHAEASEARDRYAALRAEPPQTAADRLELAILTYRFEDAAAARPLLQSLLDDEPEHPGVRFWLGRAQLETGDDAGLAHLDRAMELDPDAILPACEDAIEFLLAHDREEEAERYLRRGQERAMLLDAAAAERDDVSEEDDFDYHGLPDDVVAGVRAVVGGEPGVEEAYLVRKLLQHLEDEAPLHVIALKIKRSAEEVSDQLVNRVVGRADVGGPILVITLSGQYKPLRRKLAKVPGARIL